jgi:exopolysaccharide biosynthesis protein
MILLALPGWNGALAEDADGDVNGDGLSGADDAAVILRLADDADASDNTAADVTQNGAVDETDARVLLHYTTGQIPSLDLLAKKLQNGLCDESLFDKFSYTGVETSAGEYYRSDSVSITITQYQFQKQVNGNNRVITCYAADIYIQNIESFQTALSGNAYAGRYQLVFDMAVEHDALVAISGDFYYSSLHSGPVCRNGVWYRQDENDEFDLCVLGYDGMLTTYLAGTYEIEDIVAQNPYQVWCFGPALITADSGMPESYNSTSALKREHPRSAVGSDGPGHYIFLVADGRRPTYSSGFNFEGLSEFFLGLGCTVAYNLDGGRTAVMATRDGLVSVPIEPQRPVSDILYIAAP